MAERPAVDVGLVGADSLVWMAISSERSAPQFSYRAAQSLLFQLRSIGVHVQMIS
jgi:hypothetical protein